MGRSRRKSEESFQTYDFELWAIDTRALVVGRRSDLRLVPGLLFSLDHLATSLIMEPIMPRRKTKQRRGSSANRIDLSALMPRDAEELHRFVKKVLGMDVPRKAMIDGHDAPFDYLAHVYFEGRKPQVQQRIPGPWSPAAQSPRPRLESNEPGESNQSGESSGSSDCVVWANRGGGKTKLGAAATVLDLVFKPGVQVRILGGSLGQSSKMFTYLCEMFEHRWLRTLLNSEPTQRRLELANGSAAEVLAQSHTSVRGTRVHKLRCDEVEEFDPAVWEAAQLVTRSGQCGPWWVRGAVEALSTMHRPHGLMSQLIGAAKTSEGADNTVRHWRVFRWSALDVIERCERAGEGCATCVLEPSCQGRAGSATGFVRVEDLVAQRGRVSDRVWEAEMLCERPSTSASVYPDFNIERHVRSVDTLGDAKAMWVGGMDFGMRNPTVFLWALVHVRQGQPRSEWLIEVVDEHYQQGLTAEQTLHALARRNWPRLAWVGVDPAGGQKNSQSGLSEIQCLQKQGYKVRHGRWSIAQGIERIRSRLDHDLLRIDPRCAKLIQAMATYHYDTKRVQSEEPVKDGPDHACDALRYLVMNLEESKSGAVKVKRY